MEVKRLSEVNKESYMIPVKDDIPTRETPVVNYLLIAINVIVYLFMALAGPETQEAIVTKYAMIPAHLAKTTKPTSAMSHLYAIMVS